MNEETNSLAKRMGGWINVVAGAIGILGFLTGLTGLTALLFRGSSNTPLIDFHLSPSLFLIIVLASQIVYLVYLYRILGTCHSKLFRSRRFVFPKGRDAFWMLIFFFSAFVVTVMFANALSPLAPPGWDVTPLLMLAVGLVANAFTIWISFDTRLDKEYFR